MLSAMALFTRSPTAASASLPTIPATPMIDIRPAAAAAVPMPVSCTIGISEMVMACTVPIPSAMVTAMM